MKMIRWPTKKLRRCPARLVRSVWMFEAELERRMADVESGHDKGFPAEEVHRRISEEYG